MFVLSIEIAILLNEDEMGNASTGDNSIKITTGLNFGPDSDVYYFYTGNEQNLKLIRSHDGTGR